MCAPAFALQAFRKAIGVRIKEETELIEGEVRPRPPCSMRHACNLTAAACAACCGESNGQQAHPTPSGTWQTTLHRKCHDLHTPLDSRLDFVLEALSLQLCCWHLHALRVCCACRSWRLRSTGQPLATQQKRWVPCPAHAVELLRLQPPPCPEFGASVWPSDSLTCWQTQKLAAHKQRVVLGSQMLLAVARDTTSRQSDRSTPDCWGTSKGGLHKVTALSLACRAS